MTTPARGEPSIALSVVIPNYNHAAYLKHCIAQHVAQSKPPDEIIVVDDASSDDSLAVLEDLRRAHPVLRVIRRTTNGGPVQAIASGTDVARHAFVRISSVDDEIDPRLFERSLEILAKHPEAGMCFSDSGLVLEASNWRHRQGLSTKPIYIDPAQALFILRRNLFMPSSTSLVFRRCALERIGGFRPELDWHADWFAKYALLLSRGACFIPENLSFYRPDPNSYSETHVGGNGERELLYRWLDAVREYDGGRLYPRFRRACLLSEYSLRALWWLARAPDYRHYITPRLTGRVLARAVWHRLMPLVPMSARVRARTAWARLVGTGRPQG